MEGFPGFTEIEDTRYHLRYTPLSPFPQIKFPLTTTSPEAIESIFILYRITGDQTLQDSAWRMFQSIAHHTEAQYGNAALEDITKLPPPKADTMESFWTAETLKYFYLIFSEPDVISLDKYVLNTEAHPFKRPA